MLIVWNDDGSFRGAHLDERIEYEDGSTRNTQRPLTESDADELIGKVDADTIAQLDTAKASIVELTSELDQLKAKLWELRPPHNPRYIKPDAWYARMSLDNVSKLFTLSETDKVAKQFIGSFTTVKGEGRLMFLDHPSAQQGIAYLTQMGVFTQEEAAKMLADSTEAEAT